MVMKAQEKIALVFYQNLGKLFYAIAAADKKVHQEEFHKLKELVKKYWLDVHIIEGAKLDDATNQIEIIFNVLDKQELSAETCFNDFVNYKNEQKHLFTDKINSLIIKTASKIAYAFSGINKSELILLAKLDIELKNV